MDIITCSQCGESKEAKPGAKGEPKLPRSWRRHPAGEVWCDACWKREYSIRAVTIPVAGPIDPADWPALRESLKSAWSAVTDIANWATTELARNDTPRTADQARLAKAPNVYLYPGARKVAPDLTPTCVAAVLNSLGSRYAKKRYEVLWRREASMPVYRYPQPVPFPAQAWSACHGPHEEPCVSLRLGDRRWLLRLRGGSEFRRQLADWNRLRTGEAVPVEMSLIGQSVAANGHRNGLTEREPGGMPAKQTRIMAKLVGWFPRRGSTGGGNTLYLRTDGDAFFVYHVGLDGEVKYLHADHVRRWECQHRRRLKMMADDTKHEKRWPAKIRRRQLAANQVWSEKYRNRLDSFTHEATAMIVGYAVRRKCSTVVYDDSIKTFSDRFPWFAVKEKLRYKLDQHRIALEIVGKKEDAGERRGEPENPDAARNV